MVTMKSDNKALSELLELQKEKLLLESISSVLAWDQETNMPEKAIGYRAEQMAWLSGRTHRRATRGRWGELFEELKGYVPANDREAAMVRITAKEYREALAFPEDYVTEKSRHYSQSQGAWIKARETNDFALFKPYLEKTVDFARRDADYLGYETHPYNALLDQFEPAMTVAEVKALFDPLGDYLAGLVKRIAAAEPVRDDFLSRSCPVDQQEKLGRKMLELMGYPFDRGRLDATAHPFTIGLGADDVRVTTRYDEKDFLSNLFSVIHEGGHGLYELGIDPELAETVLCQGVSMGIHESQSRLWENLLGRSRPFCRGFLPLYREYFPDAFGDIDLETFYRGINRVRPSHIRVEADEVTYSLHVILRFNLELALLEGSLEVKDLPDAWNAESVKLLGIEPELAADGVLQDVHWSQGMIGYFPTYALGNLYSAQFMESMKKDIPDLDSLLEKRECAAPLTWLRERIHSHGAVYPAGTLCEMVTGEPLRADYFTAYLENKYSPLYGV